jgi:hypothetical protein
MQPTKFPAPHRRNIGKGIARWSVRRSPVVWSTS